MSNLSPDRAPLLTYAIACVLLDEIDAQGLALPEVQELSGIPARSWNEYFSGRTPGVKLEKWAAVSHALGLRTSVVLERAEDRLEALPDTDVALLVRLGGPAAMRALLDIWGNEQRNPKRGEATEDPSQPSNGRLSRSA